MSASVSVPPTICVIVVLYESAGVIDDCLASLAAAAPRRGVRVIVVDNASADDGAERARRAGATVVRLERNGGYAAGVNAGFAAADSVWLGVLNPDARATPGAFDTLADALEAVPRAALAGPRVRHADGSHEGSTGPFPTYDRERAHAWALDRLLGLPGRHTHFPRVAAAVDWVSGCAWLLRAQAARQTGALDERYFMYYEDVDYCRRLHDAGWQVLAVPQAEVIHEPGTGSTRSGLLPADGGAALVRYFERHHPELARGRIARTLRHGWGMRAMAHKLLAITGDPRSRRLAARYELALASLES